MLNDCGLGLDLDQAETSILRSIKPNYVYYSFLHGWWTPTIANCWLVAVGVLGASKLLALADVLGEIDESRL